MKNVKYKDYPYRRAYAIINLLEKSIRHINIDNNLRSKDVDLFRETIYESDTPEEGSLKINDIKDILQSYYMILYRKNTSILPISKIFS